MSKLQFLFFGRRDILLKMKMGRAVKQHNRNNALAWLKRVRKIKDYLILGDIGAPGGLATGPPMTSFPF